jgi:hypothetical protein
VSGQIEHYRMLTAKTPFSLGELEAYCATLRAHQLTADTRIDCSYQVTLSVRLNEALISPAQLRALP